MHSILLRRERRSNRSLSYCSRYDDVYGIEAVELREGGQEEGVGSPNFSSDGAVKIDDADGFEFGDGSKETLDLIVVRLKLLLTVRVDVEHSMLAEGPSNTKRSAL